MDPYTPNTPDKYPQAIGVSIATGFLVFVFPYSLKKRRSKRIFNNSQTRRPFSEEQKTIARKRQDGRCLRCGQYPSIWEYHHRNGDRSNNDTSNCEAICPTCHAKLERDLD